MGTFAIQLAHLRGARIITTVSPQNVEFVKGLGADETVDYNAVPFETRMADVDIVLGPIDGETLERSWAVLKPNGRMVTIATASESITDERVKRAFLLVEPRKTELQHISKLIDSGVLQVVVDTVIPMSQAADGYAGSLHRTGRGKVVVTIT